LAHLIEGNDLEHELFTSSITREARDYHIEESGLVANVSVHGIVNFCPSYYASFAIVSINCVACDNATTIILRS
jgi:hypothetical protein